MSSVDSKKVSIAVNESTRVSGLLECPQASDTCMLLAPGAGAGMEHPFLAALAKELALRGISTLRYQFPYMELGHKRPDPPPLCHATVRAAVATARQLLPQSRLIAGGKSFGGRMTSQAQAAMPLIDVSGLVFWGFPLHPAGKPSIDRAAHLAKVKIPLLFLQGTRDALAELSLLRPLVAALPLATLKEIEGADHSFHVPARSGRTDAQVRTEMIQDFLAWSESLS
jgi:predicted alpha/beta-hydrolase family hydrolase